MPYSKHPSIDEYPPYFEQYISRVNESEDVLAHLKKQQSIMLDTISSLNENELSLSYAEGKWTVAELINHIIDTERIFAYRALSIARGEKNELPGFDHDDYVANSFANMKSKLQLMEEYETSRRATIALFQGFEEACVERKGIANGNAMSVRALLYIIAGHELHHVQILEERYL